MATQVATAEETANALPALTPEGERFALRQRQARMFAMSPLVPEHLRKGTPEQAIANCWIALTLAEAMGEVALIVMQNILVVNGKAGFASQYMIARANSSGVLKGRIDWRIDRSDPDNLSVTAYAFLKETGGEVSVTCDMKMAKAEGWTKNPKYSSMPEVMLRYRSAAFLVRFYAPDVMLGYQTTEEIEDVGAAAAPSQPPLNAKMLIEQSRPAETSHDPETGELIEQDEGSAEQEEAAAAEDVVENSDRSDGEENRQADADPHPGKALADAIIEKINAPENNAGMDIVRLLTKHELDLQSMLDEDRDRVETAAAQRKEAIREEQERAKAREGVE